MTEIFRRSYFWLYLLGVVGLFLSLGWLHRSLDWEPAIVFVGSIATLIATYSNDNDRRARSNDRSRCRNEAVAKALTRIQQERHNFERLRQPRKYSSEAHRKAVEEKSFELLDTDLAPLENFWLLRRLTQKVRAEAKRLRSAKEKDVSAFIPLLTKLESRLVKPRGRTYSNEN